MMQYLSAKFIGTKKVYTLSSTRDHMIPKKVLKFTHSATRPLNPPSNPGGPELILGLCGIFGVTYH